MQHSNKIFLVAMGTGEVGQGVAFAKYAISQGFFVTFAIFDSKYLQFLNLDTINARSIVIDASVQSLNQAVTQDNPDILVLCNSKILEHDGYCNNPPIPKPITISIDSNWLFSKDSPCKFMPWADAYCINIPKDVFKLGLIENGGNYDIPIDVMDKIKIVGLVPSYLKISDAAKEDTRKKYGILPEEKLIFMYASSTSISIAQQIGIYMKAIESVEALISRGNKIKIINIGNIPQSIVDINEKWLINVKSSDASEFYKILSSSDLVFQHQGLSTLEQSIAANVPIIANVKDLKDEEYEHHAHEWEISPFVRYGACDMMHFSDNMSESVDKIERLLYDTSAISKMKNCQSQLYEPGEANVMKEVVRLLKQSKING